MSGNLFPRGGAKGENTAATAPRVALVHDWLTGMRGGEKVLEALAALYPEAPIYTLIHVPGSLSDALEAHPIHTSFLQRIPGVFRRYRCFLPLFPAAIEDFDLSGYDLILSSSHCVAKGVVPGPTAVHLCYCHTPMRYAWDQEHSYFPRRRGLAARLRNLALTGLRTWDVASTYRVDGFMANSSFVAERIRRYYGREAEVVPPPVDTEFFDGVRSMTEEHSEDEPPRGEPGIHDDEPGHSQDSGPRDIGPGDYCLAVSALSPYKRVEVAIVACERLGLELRVVGVGPEGRRLERLAGPRTQLLGRVEGEELRRLYRGARLFLQPGIEDFGIASVEALACATPVVATGRGGILDIVEDGVHGVLYEGTSVEALAAAIDKSLGIRFNESKLANRAQSFSKIRFNERVRSYVSRCVAKLEAAST